MSNAGIAIIFVGALLAVLAVLRWLVGEWNGTNPAPRPLRYEVDPALWQERAR